MTTGSLIVTAGVLGRPARTRRSIPRLVLSAARELMYRLAAFIGLLVIAAIGGLVAGMIVSGLGWLVDRSPLAAVLPDAATTSTGWLIRTAQFIGCGAGPLLLAAIVLRHAPAAALGRFFGLVAVLLAPALVGLTLWSLT